jgi:ribosome-binding factor A
MSRRGYQNRRGFVGDRQASPDRKTMQLCRQVERVLSQVLGGEIDDEILLSVNVVSVTPAPDAGQLCVTVAPWAAGETVDSKDIQARLHFHAPKLRSEVAAAISRRKAPMLVYRVIKYGPIPALRDNVPANGESANQLGDDETSNFETSCEEDEDGPTS